MYVIFLFNSIALTGVDKACRIYVRCMRLEMIDHEVNNEETIMDESLGKLKLVTIFVTIRLFMCVWSVQTQKWFTKGF